MNFLIIGNIAAGKSSLADALIEKEFVKKENVFDIDDLRKECSDGTFAGEFRAWAKMLEMIQYPPPADNAIYEFSGTGKNAWFVREAIKYSKENASNTNWRVVYCSSDKKELLKRTENRVYDTPMPYVFSDIGRSLDFIGGELSSRYNTNYWGSPEIVVSTDKNSPKECVDLILQSISL